jgi:phospholipid/cholesterol/gamma-HCH transport system substrate-binding protein
MKANYFKIGIFILVAVVILVVGIVMIGAGYIGRRVVHFETYFDESVSGLTVGSAVELRGVHIGEVTHIGFLRDAYNLPTTPGERPTFGRYVRVVFAAYPQREGISTPDYIARWQRGAERGLRMRLSSNIITGQAILEGTYVDPNRYPPVEPTWQPNYPYLPSMPSELTNLKDSIDRVLRRLEELDVHGLVSTTKDLMVSLNKSVSEANIPAISDEAKALLTELRETNRRLLILVTGSPEMASENFPEVLKHLDQAIDHINALLVTERPPLDAVINNLVDVSVNLKELTETLKANPSDLIRSSPPAKTEAFK